MIGNERTILPYHQDSKYNIRRHKKMKKIIDNPKARREQNIASVYEYIRQTKTYDKVLITKPIQRVGNLYLYFIKLATCKSKLIG